MWCDLNPHGPHLIYKVHALGGAIYMITLQLTGQDSSLKAHLLRNMGNYIFIIIAKASAIRPQINGHNIHV